jgi:cyclopropane fatty-acyl-phospholipid synthase-like methyltransferase
MKERGFQQLYGIDKSRAMSSVASSLPDLSGENIKCETMTNRLTYDENTFHYVICINTIYELRDTDKTEFFSNVYKWLSVGGYFILHAVSRKKFIENHAGGEKNKVEKKFRGAKYYLLYETNTKNENKVMMTEGFVDEKTSHIRQNEKTLYLMELNKLKEMVAAAGLKYHSVISMGENNTEDFLLIFYK